MVNSSVTLLIWPIQDEFRQAGMAQQLRLLEELRDVGISPREQVDFQRLGHAASGRFDHSQLRSGLGLSEQDIRGPSDDTRCILQLECQSVARSPDRTP